MKKATKTTTSKTRTPATKPAKPAATAVKKAVVKQATAKPVVKKTTAKKASTKSSTVKKETAVSTKTTVAKTTTISAQIDVGFGNTLYIRGEGQGISWDRGAPMECVSSDTWSLPASRSTQPTAFKFLINDEVWSQGEDYTLTAERAGTYTPSF